MSKKSTKSAAEDAGHGVAVAHAEPSGGHAGHGHGDHGHADHGHELSFLRKYVFSVDHKVIGVQYAVTSLCFLFFGFILISMMRFQLAYPTSLWSDPAYAPPAALKAIFSWLGALFGHERMTGGMMSSEFYNELGAMHGTIMIFLGVVPLAVGGFGNYVMPLQIGAPDMAFPKLNMMSYWVFLPGGVIMMASFFLPDGAARSGWTSYPPLSTVAANPGQTAWLIGMVFLITSSLLGSVNFIVTIAHLRAPGLTLMRMPFFVWAQLITSFLLLLAFPPLEAAGVLQLMDRVAGTSFFSPAGLIVSGKMPPISGGGNPILYQHLFWFLAHPEVYVLILPAFGIISEIIANNTRRPLWGFKTMVIGAGSLGFMSFVVWAHHMFITGMGTTMSAFFQVTTMIISIPSVILLTCLLLSLWGSSIRFNTPMLFSLAFLPMFAIGGLTGLPLGLAASDIYLHDTYYVIGHFHYVVAPGTIFALFAGVYFWFPKVTGRKMSEGLGKLHFILSFIGMNVVFGPMFLQGLAGALRRGYDPMVYQYNKEVFGLMRMSSYGAWLLMLGQFPFILNFFGSILFGKKAENPNPWQATTLEWMAPSPPPHGNFLTEPHVYRDPYEYSVPGHSMDYWPQFQAPAQEAK